MHDGAVEMDGTCFSAPNGDGDARACVICFQSLNESDKVCRLECGHAQWHDTCVQRWLLERQTCPVCRATQCPATSFADDEETDEEGAREDLQELQCIISSLSGPMTTWGPELLAIRNGLEQRVAQLDEEHGRLESHIRSLEHDLDCHHVRLSCLQTEHARLLHVAGANEADMSRISTSPSASVSSPTIFCRKVDENYIATGFDGAAWVSAESGERQFATPAPQNCSGSMMASEEHMRIPIASYNGRSSSSESLGHHEITDAFVTAMVSRLCGAVLRAPHPNLVFRAIAPGGKLVHADLARMLCQFEAGITDIEALAVFNRLDVAKKGFLDELQWSQALEAHHVHHDSQPSELSLASDLLARIASALQRSDASPRTLFHAFGRGQPLDQDKLHDLLSSFDAPCSVVTRAMEFFNIGSSGYVEEENFNGILSSFMLAERAHRSLQQ